MAHAVPEELRVTVRRVFDGLEPVELEVGPDRGPIDLEERSDDAAASDRDAREAARPRALEDPHEDGLDLIVRGMAQRDAAGPRLAGDAREGGMADIAGRLLGGQARAVGYGHPDDARGAPESRRQRLDERRHPGPRPAGARGARGRQ